MKAKVHSNSPPVSSPVHAASNYNFPAVVRISLVVAAGGIGLLFLQFSLITTLSIFNSFALFSNIHSKPHISKIVSIFFVLLIFIMSYNVLHLPKPYNLDFYNFQVKICCSLFTD